MDNTPIYLAAAFLAKKSIYHINTKTVTRLARTTKTEKGMPKVSTIRTRSC